MSTALFFKCKQKLEVFSVLYFNVMKKGSVKKKIAATALLHRETTQVLHVGARRKMTNQQRRAGPSNLYKAHNFWGILRETPRRETTTVDGVAATVPYVSVRWFLLLPPGNYID